MNMRKKEPPVGGNFLEYIPVRNDSLRWETDPRGTVTLFVENTGLFNRAAQKLLGRPRYSQIHLDKVGSFVWPFIDGKTDIIGLGKVVEERFGDEAKPLYERLAKYFQILESYHFVRLVRKQP